MKLTERKFCPQCEKVTEMIFVSKPDVDLKTCKECGSAVSIRYKDS
jgi:Zn ribbon nucleic-acid-binding protein